MNAPRGLTLVEIVIALGVLALVTLSIATGIGTSHRSTRALEADVTLQSRGQEYLERLLAIPFGTTADGAATGAELTEVFDDDDNFGAITLHKLLAFGPAVFENAGFPVRGRFTVVVSRDLNGDGDEADPDEGRDDLLRITVTHEGRRLANRVRFNSIG